MALTSKEIEAAEKMYEFVRSYERRRKSNMWIVSSVVAISSSFRLIDSSSGGHLPEAVVHAMGWAFLGITTGSLFGRAILSRQLKASYTNSCTILGVLEREHGNELPYVRRRDEELEVEKHFAALRQLEQEQLRQHITG